jgi:hypothetical protein
VLVGELNAEHGPGEHGRDFSFGFDDIIHCHKYGDTVGARRRRGSGEGPPRVAVALSEKHSESAMTGRRAATIVRDASIASDDSKKPFREYGVGCRRYRETSEPAREQSSKLFSGVKPYRWMALKELKKRQLFACVHTTAFFAPSHRWG